MKPPAVPIASIKFGERFRKDPGDIASLAASMKQLGQLQPVILDSKNNLIGGWRRIKAAIELGWVEVQAVRLESMDDAEKALQGERDENTCREPLKPSEVAAIGRALEKLERPKAKERQREGQSRGGKGKGQVSEKVTETSARRNRETREIVAQAAGGVSGPTYQRMKAVAQAAEEDPETFGEIAAEMDRTGKVKPAFDKVMEIKKGGVKARIDRQPDAQETANGGGAKAKVDKKRKEALTIADDAINLLMRIPKTNPHRVYAFKVVTDWIRHNKGS